MRLPRRLALPCALLAVLTTLSTFEGQAAESKGESKHDDDREFTAEANPRPAGMPLSPLPAPPSLELPEPRPQAVEALNGILTRLIDQDAVTRERAARELYEAKADWVAATARKIDQLAESADRRELDRVLTRARDAARKAPDDGSQPDYVDMALLVAQPDQKAWQDLIRLVALGRVLEAIGGPAASRELVRMYVRFDLLRLEVQRRLDKIGEPALAALIETTRHPAPKIADWAKRQLSLRGKAIPQEAVRTDDPSVLASVLVALGRVGDPETARLMISFSGTDRLEVRTAARQGLVLLGESAAWQLREAFLDTTGKAAPRDWTWKRLARELFTELDRTRLAQVYQVYEEALTAHKKGDLLSMKQGFDRVLTQSPLFEGREAMAALYLEYAEAHPEPAEQAEDALRRAERIVHDEALRTRIQSRLLVLRARSLEERGLWDRTLVDRAASLDPTNDDAKSDSVSLGAHASGMGAVSRYLLAITVSALGLAGVGWIFWTARRKRPSA